MLLEEGGRYITIRTKDFSDESTMFSPKTDQQIKIVNEAYVIGPADGLKPVEKAENSAKTASTVSQSGSRTGNEE